MSQCFRPIASAADAPRHLRTNAPTNPQRQNVHVACTQCRLKRSKCDGARPVCSACVTRQDGCLYDVEEGVSRARRLRLKKEGQAKRVRNLEGMFDLLREGSSQEADRYLARLRRGELVEDIMRSQQADELTTGYVGSEAEDSSFPSQSESHLMSNPVSDNRCETSVSGALVHGRASCGESIEASKMQTKAKAPASDGLFLFILFEVQDLQISNACQDDKNDATEPATSSNSGTARTTMQVELLGGQKPLPFTKAAPACVSPLRRTIDFSARQDCRTTINLGPNFRNSFGNLPFSQSIRTNHQPSEIQDGHVRNLSIPAWSVKVMNTKPDPGSIRSAITSIYAEVTLLTQRGIPYNKIFGPYPNVAALYDKKQFESSSALCQWAAGMVHSVKRQGYDFTCFASMHVFWYTMRWMLWPSPETYADMPSWMRPTPNHLFMPHMHFFDFIIWPGIRSIAVQTLPLQEHLDWLLDLCDNIVCTWPFPLEDATFEDSRTKQHDLTDLAKEHAYSLSNWSVSPSFRNHIPYADMFVNIRD